MIIPKPKNKTFLVAPADDRRRNSLIRSGKRTSIDRRKYHRLIIDGNIILFDNRIVKLLNLHAGGVSIQTDFLIEDQSFSINLNPYFNLIIDAEIIWSKNSDDNSEYVYGIAFSNLTKKQSILLKEHTIINYELLIEYARASNAKISNIEARNAVYNFFLSDIVNALKGCLELEDMVHSYTDEDIIRSKCEAVLNSVIENGDRLEQFLNSPAVMKDIKYRARALLSSFVYESAAARHGLEKPIGYPGDYQMLEQVYENSELSEGLGKYIDRYFLNDPYCQAVRGRKNVMRDILKQSITSARDGMKILNLASGSCRDIREMFPLDTSSTAEIVCVDQDKGSLDYSRSEIDKLHTGNVKVMFSLGNILKLEKGNVKNSV